jgi:hypothetical protein
VRKTQYRISRQSREKIELALADGRTDLTRDELDDELFARYVEGQTTYSWEWERHDVWSSGSVAWLLAEGTEIAASEDQVVRHPYRMTTVLARREGD